MKIKECNTSKFQVCISTSLFKMENPYRSFDKYINKLMLWRKAIPKNAYIRLYVDASVLEETSFINLMKLNLYNLEVYLYECKELLDSSGIYHDGTFGSVVRFLPLIYKDVPKNVKYVWVTDTDMYPNMFRIDYLGQMMKVNVDISYASDACYNRPWIDSKNEYPIINKRVIVTSNFLRKANIPKNLLDKFLQKVLNGEYTKIRDEIVKNSPRKSAEYFPYGFDELFTNKFLLPYFQRTSSIIQLKLNLFKLANDTDTLYPLESKLLFSTGDKATVLKLKEYFDKYSEKNSENPCVKKYLEYRNFLSYEDFDFSVRITRYFSM